MNRSGFVNSNKYLTTIDNAEKRKKNFWLTPVTPLTLFCNTYAGSNLAVLILSEN